MLLAGCAGLVPSDPLDDVPKLSDVAVSPDADEANIAEPADTPGFFAGLFGGRSDDAATTDTADAPDTAETATDTATPAAAPGGLRMLGQLFGGGQAAAASADAPRPGTVPPLTNQDFGEVGVTCGLSRGDLGTRIASVSGYEVFDTFPNSTTPRPHYITGFNDGCARQFTAALVLTGDVGTHEVVRYQTAQSRGPYTQVDTAYEVLKASFCGAGQGQPCGSRITALGRNTHFITGYQRFTSSPAWVEILLHKGEVLAVGVETK